MTRDEFRGLMHETFDHLVELNTKKGGDYAGTEDALLNFKEQAVDCGLTPEQVWGVLFGKHYAAIKTYIREGDVQSEPIEGRIDDALLYLFLLRGLVVERREAVDRRETALAWEGPDEP